MRIPLRPTAQPLLRQAACSRRCAHAAAFSQADAEAEPSNNSRKPPPQAASARGGPQHPRARAQAHGQQQAGPSQRSDDGYRFPLRGKNGGPPDPFEVLGLKRSASAGEIKATYYKLALLLHPDSSHPSASAAHFATLNRAYKLLSSQHSRNSYLQTSYGWSPTGDVNAHETETDAAMRDMIRRAKAAGAAEWRGRGFRDSDAGGGAWRYGAHPGYDGAGSPPPGGPFASRPGHAHEQEFPQGKGEALYMSNNLFVMLIAALAGLGLALQYARVGVATGTAKEMLEDRHMLASRALAEARAEAAAHGTERRDKIRRRVRENQVMEEVDKLGRGEASGAGHGLLAVTDTPPEQPSAH